MKRPQKQDTKANKMYYFALQSHLCHGIQNWAPGSLYTVEHVAVSCPALLTIHGAYCNPKSIGISPSQLKTMHVSMSVARMHNLRQHIPVKVWSSELKPRFMGHLWDMACHTTSVFLAGGNEGISDFCPKLVKLRNNEVT